MKFAERAVIVSELDPVPSGMRCGPRVLVVSRKEARAIASGDAAVTARLRALVRDDDRRRLAERLSIGGGR